MSSIPLSIRLVRPRDIAGLPGVSSVLQLNQPEASLASYRPLAAAIASMLPGRNRPRVIVAQGDERILAFAHFVPEPPDRRWQLVALAASTGVYDVTPLWEQLIERSVVAAGLRGVKRLYARPTTDTTAEAALLAMGFQPYATETILAANAPRISGSRLPLREQTPADTWAIHQLYNYVVPRQVQYAEAFTSHRWDIGGFRAAPTGVRTQGWLLEEAFQVVAYARVMSYGTNHVLEVIVHPDWSGSTGELIDAALERAAAKSRVERVWCAVRGYQGELTSAFTERGFAVTTELTLTVKYTAARVIAPVTELAVQPEAVLERLPKPKRAPSYLFGQGEE
jgi:AcrR family transcriptional regulator